MNKRQENKLSMAKAVREALQQNNSIVATTPAFTTADTSLATVITEIDNLVQAQAGKLTGSAKDKQLAADAAIELALELIGPAKSYAANKEDNTYKDAVNYSRTSLTRLRDTILVNTLKWIKQKIEEKDKDLGDYGVTAAMISAFGDKITAYETLVSAPRSATVNKSAITKMLAPKFKQMDKLMEQLDGFANGKKSSHNEFYLAYQSARVIVDSGVKREKKLPKPPTL